MWATAGSPAGFYRYYFPAIPINYAYSYTHPLEQQLVPSVTSATIPQPILVHPSPYHSLLNYPDLHHLHQQQQQQCVQQIPVPVPEDTLLSSQYSPHFNVQPADFFPANSHDKDILEILDRKKMKQEDVEIRWRMLEQLEELLCFGNVHPFGSFLTGLGLSDSAVDVCFEDHAMRKKQVVMKLVAYAIDELENKSKQNFERDDDFLLDEKLLTDKIWKVLQVLTHTRVPTITLEHLPSKLKVDISFDNFMSIQTSKLIRFYVTLEPLVAQLCLLFRHWAKAHNLMDNRRGLKNYAITLLVIVFLVRKNFLPSVELLQSMAEPQMLSNNQNGQSNEEDATTTEWNVAFCDDLEQVKEVMKVNGIGVEKIPSIGQPGILSIALAFLQMLRKIGSLDCIVISLTAEIRSLADFAPNNQGKLPESQWRYSNNVNDKDKLNFVSRGQLYLQDPFDLGLNVTCSLDANHFRALMNALNSTIATIEDYTSNNNSNPLPLSIFFKSHVDDENLEILNSTSHIEFENEGEFLNLGDPVDEEKEEYLVETPPSPPPPPSTTAVHFQYQDHGNTESEDSDNLTSQMSTVSLVTNHHHHHHAQNSNVMAYQEMYNNHLRSSGFSTIPYQPVHFYPVYKPVPIPVQMPVPIPIPIRVPIHVPPRLRQLFRHQHQNRINSQSKSKSVSKSEQPSESKFPTNSPIRIQRPIPDSPFKEIFQSCWTMEHIFSSFCTALNNSGQASLKLFWYEATADFFKYYIQKSIPFARKSPVDSRVEFYGEKDNKSEKSLQMSNRKTKMPDACTFIFQFTLDLQKLEHLTVNEPENIKNKVKKAEMGVENKKDSSSSFCCVEKRNGEKLGDKKLDENGQAKKVIHDHRDFSAVARLILNPPLPPNKSNGRKCGEAGEKMEKEFKSTLTLTLSENMKTTERRVKGRQLLKEKVEGEFSEFTLNYVKERFRLSRCTAGNTVNQIQPSTKRMDSKLKSIPESASQSTVNPKEYKNESEVVAVTK